MADTDQMSEDENPEQGLSSDIKNWSEDQVRNWALKLNTVDTSIAEILFQQNIAGSSLVLLDTTDLIKMGVTYGPAKLLLHARDKIVISKNEKAKHPEKQPEATCKPYPFCRYHDTHRYMENSVLHVIESGPTNLIEPCHEYKGFNKATAETRVKKFTTEVIRFAAACMNSRTNGTIHFGIGDEPDGHIHGQVLGVVVEQKEVYATELKSAIDNHFEYKHKEAAHFCIKPPRFVGVLQKNNTSSDKWVIEVDIVPDSTVCKDSIYHTININAKKAKTKSQGQDAFNADAKPSKEFYIRQAGSSRDLLSPTTSDKNMKEYKRFVASGTQVFQLRKKAEEEHLKDIKSTSQGSRLSEMITGGTFSLDKSRFEQYLIVTNKSHSKQFESLGFLVELNPMAVLDFDPESAKSGLHSHFDKHSKVCVHIPANYQIQGQVEETASKLKLTQETSWVFCNGGVQDEAPSHINMWSMEKGASVCDVISFLCRKDVLPNKRFLVIFLLLTTVSEKLDPLAVTLSAFYERLKGTDQILCLCDNENAFNSWKDIIASQYGIDISRRCIYELSFAEVNGTILSLLSENRKCSRFLSCGGGSSVLLERKVERGLTTLDVLCVNQCEGGNEDKTVMEENFYKGGKVSWWNFYFSEQPGSTAFIQRDKFDYIINTIIPDLCSQKKACVSFNLVHLPGCGGTSLAMHTLWTLRDKFRCAVLRDNNADFAEVAEQVVTLLKHAHEEDCPRVPVLLMIDDFGDMEKVLDLQHLIVKECAQRDIHSKSTQVILLNCMRSESSQQTNPTGETVSIENTLSEKEKALFEEKLEEIEKTHTNADTLYGFMIMKKECNSEYIEGVVHDILKSFNKVDKPAQILAVLVLLNVYCKSGCLSVSLCEDFLDLQPKPFCGTITVEDRFGKFSNLISCFLAEGKVRFSAVRIIHSRMAMHCLQEITQTHNVSKADITNFLLTTGNLYESTQGKDKLLQDVHDILVKRNYSVTMESPPKFSPLIQDIARETPGLEEMVLENASKRYENDATVCQLLARYYYLQKKDFSEAKRWANKARELSKDSSYMADTLAQVTKHELRNAIAKYKEGLSHPDQLETFLKMAQSAIMAFQEMQNLAKMESIQRLQSERNHQPFNTSGYLGEIHVQALIIKVLEKTPVFSSDSVRHDLLSLFLSGNLKLEMIESSDPFKCKHRQYYKTLRQFGNVLGNLKSKMRMSFDFLDKFYVNLASRFGLKDGREQIAQKELSTCYKDYAELFCRIDSAAFLKKKAILTLPELHQKRLYLELHRADTYCGILNCLSNDMSPGIMDKIVKQYKSICANPNSTLKERINTIFANVVFSCIKRQSQHMEPYQKVIHLLDKLLHEPTQFDDVLPLYFLATMLFWPQPDCPVVSERPLEWYISQMRMFYHKEMSRVFNGKQPIVHFYLGKKQGYDHFVTFKEIMSGQEEIALMCENGKLWREKKVEELLCRVHGKAQRDCILVDNPNQKIEVSPVFRSELRRHVEGSKVSFFIGFSMKGPVALDIN